MNIAKNFNGGENIRKAILLATILLLMACVSLGSSSTSYAADLELTKTVNYTTPNLGDRVNFTITVNNTDYGYGDRSARNVRVTDQLPSNLTYVSYSASQGTYNNATGIWTVGTIGERSFATINITAIVNTVGTTTNTARTGCDEDPDNGGYDDGNHHASATINCNPAADLSITKTVTNSTPNFGQNVIFRINVTNKGPSGATGVRVSDLLPAGLVYQSSSASAGTSYNSGTGLWTIGNLNNGATVSLNITALVNGTGFFNNIANVSGNQHDQNMSNNIANASLNVPLMADLKINKTVNNSTPNFGQNVVFTVNVTNLGPNNATGVNVSDLLPAGLVYQSSSASPGTSYNSGTGLWTIGNLNVGSSVSLNITALVNSIGTITNVANVSGSQFDQNMSNNIANASVTVPAASDLKITKTVNNTAPNYLDNVIFTVVVTNLGPSNASSVVVSDLLPAGLSWVSDNSGGSYNHGTGLWTIGNLNVGSSVSLNITALVNGTGFFNNIANVSGNQYDQNMSNNIANASLTVPLASDLKITKTVDNSTPNYLGNVVFTVTVTNAGPSNATGVKVSDLLPAGLSWVSDNSGGAYDHTTGLWTIGNLNVGSSVSLNITALVNGTGFFNNIANVSGSQYDQNMSNNIANASINVPASADIAVTKSVNNSTPNYLDNVTFTVTVTNNGPNDASSVVVSDLLPAGLSWVSDNSGGAYDHASGVWTVGGLASGASATLQVVAQVLGHNTTITNYANGSSELYDWNTTNNEDSASVTVPPAADIAVTKDVNNTAPNYWSNVVFTVIVHNNGPDDATGVTLSDLLPAGLSWVSDNSGGAYDHATGLWTIGSLADGASRTLQIVAQVLGHNTIIDNVANASAIEFDPNLTNNRANVTITVPASADIEVTKTVNNSTPNYMGSVIFTVTVTNKGPDDATGVKVSDLLPAGLVWISDNASQGSYDHVTGIWNIGDLYMEQGPVTLNITAQVTKTGKLTNIANGSSDLYDWNLTNNAANATVSIPQTSELELTKTVDKVKVKIGDTVKYTITVINHGPDAALNTVVTDILPSSMEYVSSIASQGSYDPNTGLWTIGTMANGASETLEIFVKVIKAGTFQNVATVGSSSSNPGTNTSDVTIEVSAAGGGDNNGTSGNGTVSMQDTGMPINLLVIALLTIVAGMVLPKRKN